MKNIFFEHHKYSDETFLHLMDNAIFVLDTNILLHFYRYNGQNVIKLFEVLDKIKDRLWSPYQTIYEFYKNRTKLIENKATFLDDLKQQITKDLNKTKAQIDNPNSMNNPYTFLRFEDDLKKFVVSKLDGLVSDVITHIDSLTNQVTIDYLTNEDPMLEKIATFLEGKVGSGFDKIRLGKIYEDGKNRYNNQVPPGYEDKTKPEPERYGDLVIWEEIIDFASTNKKDIIYITDDVKEDWWYIIRGKKAGPRHELIREFKKRTGYLFYIYTSEKFIDLISSKYQIENTESLLEESKEVVNSISFEKIAYSDEEIENTKKAIERAIIFQRAEGKCESCGSSLIDENGRRDYILRRKNINENFSVDNGWAICQECSDVIDKIRKNIRNSIPNTGIICSRCKLPTMGIGRFENECSNCGFVTDD